MCAFCDELIIYRSGLLWDDESAQQNQFVTTSHDGLCLMGSFQDFSLCFVSSGSS